MQRLPNDVLGEIFALLPRKGPARLTCRRFRALVDKRFPPTVLLMPPFDRSKRASGRNRYRALFKQLAEILAARTWTHLPVVIMRGAAMKMCPDLVTVINRVGVEHLRLYKNPFSVGDVALKTLKRVEYEGTGYFGTLALLLSDCPLEELTYHPTDDGFDRGCYFGNLCLLKQLRRLTLWLRVVNTVGFECYQVPFPDTLRSLCFIPSRGDMDISLDNSATLLPNLEELTIGTESSIRMRTTSWNLQCWGKPPPLLRRLKVFVESRDHLRECLECLSLLKQLDSFDIVTAENLNGPMMEPLPFLVKDYVYNHVSLRQLSTQPITIVDIMGLRECVRNLHLEYMHVIATTHRNGSGRDSLKRIHLKKCQLEDRNSPFPEILASELVLENCVLRDAGLVKSVDVIRKAWNIPESVSVRIL